MTLNDKSEQIGNLASLVAKKRTGNASQLARRISVSRSKLYDIFEELKSMGIDIKYDRCLNTFYYANNLRIKVNVPIEVIAEEEILTVNGGKYYRPYPQSLLLLN